MAICKLQVHGPFRYLTGANAPKTFDVCIINKSRPNLYLLAARIDCIHRNKVFVTSELPLNREIQVDGWLILNMTAARFR